MKPQGERFRQRIALVTGAARGIGAAIVKALADEGAVVVGVDVLDEPLFEVCATTGATALPFDITNASAWAACVEQLKAQHGVLDILINNAAVCSYATIQEDTDAQWERTLAVNLLAVRLGVKAMLPLLQRSKCPRIVNVGSTQAIANEARVGAYAASKGALLALTRSLAVDLAPDGILVNAIAPGCIHTPLSIVDGVDETTTPLFQEWYVERRKIPLARPGRPAEIAAVAAFLSSDDCSYMTGHTLVADGGLTITF